MLQLLGERVGTKLETRRVRLSPGVWVDVDGASDDPPILCEAFAHQGSAKAGQSRKIGQDILKLLLLRRVAEESGTPLPRLILLFADPAAAQACGSRSWKGEAVRRFGIQVELVDLPPDLHDRVLQAQERQRR